MAGSKRDAGIPYRRGPDHAGGKAARRRVEPAQLRGGSGISAGADYGALQYNSLAIKEAKLS